MDSLAQNQLRELWAAAERLADVDFARYVIAAFPQLVDPFVEMAGMLAATWFEESNPASPYVAVTAPALPEERLTESARWALGGDGTVALDRLSGTLQRAIFDGARDTTVLNSELEPGTRWARHASANACEFCRMLAIRGAVYRTEYDAVRVGGRSVDLSLGDRRMIASGQATRDELLKRRMDAKVYLRGSRKGQAKTRRQRGSQALGEKYHDNCHCVAVEVRVGGAPYEPPDYVARWEQEYYDAVAAAREAGETKGDYGAIDINAVMKYMRRN